MPIGRETPRNDSYLPIFRWCMNSSRQRYLIFSVTNDGYMSNIFGFDREFGHILGSGQDDRKRSQSASSGF